MSIITLNVAHRIMLPACSISSAIEDEVDPRFQKSKNVPIDGSTPWFSFRSELVGSGSYVQVPIGAVLDNLIRIVHDLEQDETLIVPLSGIEILGCKESAAYITITSEALADIVVKAMCHAEVPEEGTKVLCV